MSEDAPPADAPPAEGEAPAPKPKLGGLARFKKAVGGVKAANAFTPGGLSKLPKKDPSPTPSAAPSEAGDAAPKKNPLAKLKSAVTKISAANAFGKAAPNMAKKPPSAAPSRAGSVMGEPAPSIASLGGFKKAAGSKPPSRAVSVMGDENDDPGMKKGAKSVKGSSRATTPAGKDGTVAGSAPHSPAKSVKSKAAEDLPEVKGAPPPMDAINQRIAALEDLARHSLGASGAIPGAARGGPFRPGRGIRRHPVQELLRAEAHARGARGHAVQDEKHGGVWSAGSNGDAEGAERNGG